MASLTLKFVFTNLALQMRLETTSHSRLGPENGYPRPRAREYACNNSASPAGHKTKFSGSAPASRSCVELNPISVRLMSKARTPQGCDTKLRRVYLPQQLRERVFVFQNLYTERQVFRRVWSEVRKKVALKALGLSCPSPGPGGLHPVRLHPILTDKAASRPATSEQVPTDLHFRHFECHFAALGFETKLRRIIQDRPLLQATVRNYWANESD